MDIDKATTFYVSTSHKNKSNTPPLYNADEVIEWMAKYLDYVQNKPLEENIFDSDDEDIIDQFEQCNICGLTDDHAIGCPNNNSPFNELITNGYD